MKKENGFTLIELLAVIIILSMIIIISAPRILEVVNKTKNSAADSSLKLVKKAIKTQLSSSVLTGDSFTKESDGCYVFDFDDQSIGNSKKINLKNKEKIKGSIKYCDNTFKDDTLKFDGISSDSTNTKVICKRASVLHTEECTKTDNSSTCSGAGLSGQTITYGNLGSKGVLQSGDAFDCDVNADGEYNSSTERFYYVSDYYNTTTKAFESDTAVLIYYNNVNGGNPAVNKPGEFVNLYAYHGGDYNRFGPLTAILQLPTVEQWSNISLKNESRAILNEKEGSTTAGGTLPSNFSYSGYAARLLTIQEVKAAANNNSLPTWINGELNNHNYLFENTVYANDSRTLGWWLETPESDNSNYAFHINGLGRKVDHNSSNNFSCYGVRPAIDVLKVNMKY